MNKFRIYPTKEATIASSSAFENLNSSQNPIADLWYGGGIFQNNIYRPNSISRHLIQFDLTELQSKFLSKEINQQYVVSYKLKMKNSAPGAEALSPEFERNTLNKSVASSFDLIAFPINKSWDEGNGYSLLESHYIINKSGNLNLTGNCNWLSATSISSWTEPGVYTNPTASTPFYSTQHFELGAEDIDINVTSIVNDWLSGGTTNNGLAIAFTKAYENISADTRYISSFYTRKTNSAFKPYLEVEYNQVIRDDRHKVTNNKISRLYLYLLSGNTQVNYASASTVDIKNSAGAVVHADLVPTQHSKGIYFVDVWMSGTTKGQKFKDVWKGVSINPPYDQQDIIQNFEIRDNYLINQNKSINEYVITTFGIDNASVIQPGEIRRTYIEARINYSLNRPVSDFNLEYQLTMNNNINIIDWTPANESVINNCTLSFVDIDTSWLLSNQNYQISFRISELGTKKVLSEKIQFKVVDKLYPQR